MMQRLQNTRSFIQRNPLALVLISMGWNVLYAVFNGILGLVYSSYWYVTLCVFYAVLGLMRLSAITIGRSKKWSEISTMKVSGAGILILGIVLCGMTFLTIWERHNPARNTIIMISIAIFTFALAAWSIRNIVKASRQRSPLMITLCNISCAGAVGSVLSLERAMIGTFGNPEYTSTVTIEAASGAVAFFLLIGIGIGMIYYANHINRNRSNEP